MVAISSSEVLVVRKTHWVDGPVGEQTNETIEEGKELLTQRWCYYTTPFNHHTVQVNIGIKSQG